MIVDPDVIPVGLYCYEHTGEKSQGGFPLIKQCPYWFSDGKGVICCPVAQVMAVYNHRDAAEQATKYRFHGSDELRDNICDGSLIWDMVKECGINVEEDEGHDCWSCGKCAC